MCFTETFLDKSDIVKPEDIGRPDMEVFRFDRNPNITPGLQKGGGIMIAVRKDLNPVKFAAPYDIAYLEYGCIKVTIMKTVYTIFCFYCRPQGKVAQFIKQLTELFNLISTKEPTAILGDFNEDISQPNPKITKFLNEKGFLQYISTRTNDSGSIIDHIYFNKNTLGIRSKVVDIFCKYRGH